VFSPFEVLDPGVPINDVFKMSALGTVHRLISKPVIPTFTYTAGSFIAAATEGCTISSPSSLRWSFYRPQIRCSSTLPSSPIFEAIANHEPTSSAVIHGPSGRKFNYGSLLHDVATGKDKLSAFVEGRPLAGQRIAFLAENSYDYVGAQTVQESILVQPLTSSQK